MPKATAIWLIDNTTLTFEQIADFCGLHPLEVQSIADGESATHIQPFDPVMNGFLTKEELERCSKDPKAELKAIKTDMPQILHKTKGTRYTPLKSRQDKPDAIAWFVKHYPQVSDREICKLIGTTKHTVEAVRSKTHWNSQNISPQSPANLGICTTQELQDLIRPYILEKDEKKEQEA